MKNTGAELLKRIDALTVRERIFLFCSAIACIGALFEAVWLSPAQLAHEQTAGQLERQVAELESLREAIKATANGQQVPAAEQELQGISAELEASNQKIQGLLPPAEGTPLVQTFTHLLKRYPGLLLVNMMAEPPELRSEGSAKTTALPPGLTRQGIAVTVAGAYPNLMDFVSTLEKELPYVRWGAMSLKTEQSKPELTLHLYLLTEVVP